MLVDINCDEQENIGEDEQCRKVTHRNVLPKIIVDFSDKSRNTKNNSYRLLKRCLRHALDPRAADIRYARGEVIKYEGITGIKIYHKVRASMRDETYNVVVAFTSEKLVACSCDCRVGGHDNHKFVCVHILPVLYQVTELVFKGLAEHLLVELSSFTSANNVFHNTDRTTLDMFQTYLVRLQVACQDAEDDEHRKSIDEILAFYSVGTERAKRPRYLERQLKHTDGPVNHRLLRDCKLISPTQQAKRLLVGTAEDATVMESCDDVRHLEQTVEQVTLLDKEQYQNLFRNMMVVRNSFIASHEMVVNGNLQESKCNFPTDLLGFKLVEIRSSYKYDNYRVKRRDEKQWNILIRQANQERRKQNPAKLTLYSQEVAAASHHTIQDETEQNETEQKQENVIVKLPSNKKQSYDTCCSGCCFTTYKTPESKFYRVPNTVRKQPDRFDNDNVKFLYEKAIVRRKIFFDRLEIATDKWNKQYLTYCNLHELETIETVVKWNNNKGHEVSKLANILVPVHLHAPTVVTRSQDAKRKKRLSVNDQQSGYTSGGDDVGEQESTEEQATKKKQYVTCCCPKCDVTSTKKPIAKFFRVPKTSRKKPEPNDNDEAKLLFEQEMHKRKLCLHRLSITDDEQKDKHLYYCDLHYGKETVKANIKFKNQNGVTITREANIVIPVKDTKKRKNRSTRCTSSDRTRKKQRHCEITPDSVNTNDDGGIEEKEQVVVVPTGVQTNNRKCNIVGCTYRQYQPNIHLKQIPPPIIVDHQQNMLLTNSKREKIAYNQAHRQLCLQRISIDVDDQRKDIRICNMHTIETVEQTIQYVSTTNNIVSVQRKMNVPVDINIDAAHRSCPKRVSFGVGTDREIFNSIKRKARELHDKNLDPKDIYTLLEAISKQNENSMSVQDIKRIVSDVTGAAQYDTDPTDNTPLRIPPTMQIKPPSAKHRTFNDETVFKIKDVDDEEIKDRTGFSSLAHMLCFSLLLCNGSFDELGKTVTRLTWFEEWLMYHEINWSRSVDRWKDSARMFGIRSSTTCRRMYLSKLCIHLSSRKQWPPFVTIDEDELLRKPKFNTRQYKGKRIIFWDNTDVRFNGAPSDASLQKLTWSQYYNGNVAKGAVGVQLCGWITAEELWTGGISDSEYMVKSGILEKQSNYIPLYDAGTNEQVSWLIVLDRGYRGVNVVAWKLGGQIVVQPAFAKSDRQFSSAESLMSAAIASDRAANERAVNFCKASGFIQKGLRYAESTAVLSDVWLAWSFQVNFLYKPVV